MASLPEPIHVAVLGLVIGAVMSILALAQRFGEWRSRSVAKLLGVLAAVLMLCWVYLAALWVFQFDLRAWVEGYRVLWVTAGVFSVIGLLAWLAPKAAAKIKPWPKPGIPEARPTLSGFGGALEQLFIPGPVIPPREFRAGTSGKGVQRFEVGVKPTRLVFRPSQIAIEAKDLPKEMDFGTYKLTVACEGTALVINDHNAQRPLDVSIEHASTPIETATWPKVILQYDTSGFQLSNVSDFDAVNVSIPRIVRGSFWIDWDCPSIVPRRSPPQPITVSIRDSATKKVLSRKLPEILERGWQGEINMAPREGNDLIVDVYVLYDDLGGQTFESHSDIKYELSTKEITAQFTKVERHLGERH